MTSTEQIIEWNAQWRLINGSITCRACHAEQKEAEKGTAFVHAPGCGNAFREINPGKALDDIAASFK